MAARPQLVAAAAAIRGGGGLVTGDKGSVQFGQRAVDASSRVPFRQPLLQQHGDVSEGAVLQALPPPRRLTRHDAFLAYQAVTATSRGAGEQGLVPDRWVSSLSDPTGGWAANLAVSA